MQFSDALSIRVESFGKYYNDAVSLAEFIDNPAPMGCSPSFEDRLNRIQFPLFVAHCSGLDPHKMSVSQRLQLKTMLLDELRTKVEKTREEIECAKMIGDIALPSDPKECKSKLLEMTNHAYVMKEKIDQDIAAYNEALHSNALLALILNKHTTVVYDEDAFTKMPN